VGYFPGLGTQGSGFFYGIIQSEPNYPTKKIPIKAKIEFKNLNNPQLETAILKRLFVLKSSGKKHRKKG